MAKSERSSLRGNVLVVLRALIFAFLATGALCFAQDSSQDANAVPIPTAKFGEETPSFTFKAITRMVIVEVVARDREDNPVRNLTAEDLRVSEKIDGATELPEKIASLRVVNDPGDRAANEKGIVLGWLHKSFCGLAGAYELSYYLSPESRKDGLHRIAVTSSRKGLRLFFRPGYRIEADKPAEVNPTELANKSTDSQLRKLQAVEDNRKKHPEMELAIIACYDTLNTTNLPLEVQKKDSKQGTAYQFVVSGSYFASLHESQPAQLDFSLCTFESGGHPLRHFDGTAQAGTDLENYRLLSSQGFTHTIVVEPTPMQEFSARLVVRDRATGALGAGEILLLPMGRDQFPAPIPEGQTNSIFGTPTRTTPLAMCGDVYQLAPWTPHLPLFSEIDATAPIYASTLGVYDRFFILGIPGVTNRTEWFGVNYQGVFGIDRPGKYEFYLLSDDGAKVYIDDKLVVSDDTLHSVQDSRGKVSLEAGAHNIRVSYFQGPRTEVALVLLIKPPGQGWRLFDTTDFPDPSDPAAQRKKLPLR